MKKLCLSISFSILIIFQLSAQTARFITEGEILFEKTVNMYAVLKKGIESTSASRIEAYGAYKKEQPQFLVLKSKLAFNKLNTYFVPEPSTLAPGLSYFSYNPIYSQINKIHIAINSDSSTIQKEVFGQVFLLKDKKESIKWKITDETREIAGYTCRRANGLVADSIYVVAFYTNKIPISAGPESFYGLPGMILGIAVPEENVTWFATEVTERKIASNVLVAPSKGKIITKKELLKNLTETLKASGTFSTAILLGYLL